MTLAGFGGVAGVFALFFFTDIPRVRKDIVTKIPIIGQYYVKEVPASDNVGGISSLDGVLRGKWSTGVDGVDAFGIWKGGGEGDGDCVLFPSSAEQL